MKTKHWILHLLPAALWFGIMCLLFFMPGSEVPSLGWAEKLKLDKIAHFILFFVLILLISVPILKSALSPTRKLQWIFGMAGLFILWGIATEFIQLYYVKGRSFDLFDWVADSLGVLAGLYFIQRIKTAFPE